MDHLDYSSSSKNYTCLYINHYNLNDLYFHFCVFLFLQVSYLRYWILDPLSDNVTGLIFGNQKSNFDQNETNITLFFIDIINQKNTKFISIKMNQTLFPSSLSDKCHPFEDYYLWLCKH